jgi:transcriptional regulator with XRE-family HTH domain
MKMTRQAISDLENGRRRYVTTAELVILAAALNTSPVNLVYPGPYDVQVELMPGVSVLEFDAAEWFSGVDTYLFNPGEVFSDRPDKVEKFQQWKQWEGATEALRQWRELKELIITRDNMDNPDHLATLSRQIKSAEDRLRRLLGRPIDRDAIDPPLKLKVAEDD